MLPLVHLLSLSVPASFYFKKKIPLKYLSVFKYNLKLCLAWGETVVEYYFN